MLNRRWPIENRRYARREKLIPETVSGSLSDDEKPQEIKGIPLPNMAEDYGPNMADRLNLSSVFGFLKNIKLEEIILVGLILLLLEGGIEDEFFLLMLVYILLF